MNTKYTPYIQNKTHFLEVGPGPGFMTTHFASQFDHVTVFEPNANFATQLAEKLGPSKIAIFTDYFDEMTFTSSEMNKYDLII